MLDSAPQALEEALDAVKITADFLDKRCQHLVTSAFVGLRGRIGGNGPALTPKLSLQ